jgi:hypothetical protein
LESEIQEPLANKQHHVAISFDLGKAYDTAWRYNIIRTLWNLEMKGNMLFFISNFIRNRRFCVLIGNILSDVHSQANGILSLNGFTWTHLYLYLKLKTTWHLIIWHPKYYTPEKQQHADDFRLPRYNRTYTQNSLWHAGFNEFNKLPTSVKTSENLNYFKEEVKKHLKLKYPIWLFILFLLKCIKMKMDVISIF